MVGIFYIWHSLLILPQYDYGKFASVRSAEFFWANSHKMKIWAGMMMGCIAAMSYILLMFYFDPFYSEPLFNFQKHTLIAVFVFLEQMIIYGGATLYVSGYPYKQ